MAKQPQPEESIDEQPHASDDHTRLQELESRVDELTADLKRSQADFVNYRRRSESERGDFINLAKRDVINQVLPLLDNVGRALSHLPGQLKDDAWAKGVQQLAKQSDDILKGLGVERFDSKGEEFDPNLHEAIGIEDGEGDREVVIEELQPGYRLDGQVIRHAIVKVGKQ